MFADFFKSNFVSNLEVSGTPLSINVPRTVEIGSMSVTEIDIINGIAALQSSLKNDLDGISTFFLKKCSSSICVPLNLIFNLSLSTGVFIDRWKLASITPIYKSGNKNDVRNYRPISKLTNCSKLFEKLVNNKLLFTIKNIIDPRQHGFICGRSTVTNLVVFSQYCISALMNSCQVDTIYTDFSKAFDTVSHNILSRKLECLGFHSTFMSWLRSYLSNRKSFVQIENTKSYTFVASSGVPQGSILGPILFSLFINDIGDCFNHCKFLLYADDLKLFSKVTCQSDTSLIQQDLNNLVAWSVQNKLSLNIKKCFHVTFSKSLNVIPSSYTLSNVVLSKVKEFSDLGVTFDSGFTFVTHVSQILPKAYANLAFLRRYARDFKDPYTRKIVYNSLVRSKLEYASLVWNPIYASHSNRIERVQRSFIRFALQPLHFSDPLPPYSARRMLINLGSLANRRTLQSLMFIFDVICGSVDCPDVLEQIGFNVPHKTLRFYHPFNVKTVKSNYYNFAPITRALTELNSIYRVLDLDFAMPRFLFHSRIASHYL